MMSPLKWNCPEALQTESGDNGVNVSDAESDLGVNWCILPPQTSNESESEEVNEDDLDEEEPGDVCGEVEVNYICNEALAKRENESSEPEASTSCSKQKNKSKPKPPAKKLNCCLLADQG